MTPSRQRVLASRFNSAIYGATNGRIAGSFGGHPVLLLTTRGRKTGKARRTPVQFESIDGSLVIAAAAAGSTHAPLWCENLRADNRAVVQIRADHSSMLAIEAVGDDQSRLWQQMIEINPELIKVQRRAGRVIPLFRLQLQGDAAD